ncbi:hypothetical protein GGF31_006794 [Allomyces arbusculus]|nr:hypothetical protein GGF31_006794 [Allomyces arbusculus]
MGRKKVRIQPIADARPRQVTFIKRKTGLLKKCFELSTLCSCDVAVLIFSATGKLTEYASNGDLDSVLLRYTEYTKPHEIKSNQDFLDDGAADKSKSAKSVRNDDDDDDAGGDSDHDGAAAAGAVGPSGTTNTGPAATPLLAPNPQSIMPAPGTGGVMHHVGHHPQAGPYPIQLQPQQPQPPPPPPPAAQYQQQPFQTHGAFYGHVPQPQQQPQPQASAYGGGQDMTGPFHAFGAAPVQQHHPHQHHQQAQHFQGTPMQHPQQPFGPPMFSNDMSAAAAMYGATAGQVSVPPQLSYTVDPATGYVTAVDPAAAARGNTNDQYAAYQAGGIFHPQQQQQQQHPQPPFPLQQPQQQQHSYTVQSHAYAQPHPQQQHLQQQQQHGYSMQQVTHPQQQQQQQPFQPAVFTSGAPTQLAPAAEPTTGFLAYDQVPPPSSSGAPDLANPLTQATQLIAPSPASTAAAAGSPALTAAMGSPAMTARAGSASVAPSPLVVGQKRARDDPDADRESASPQSAKRKPHFARRAPFSLKVQIPGTATGEGDMTAGAGAAVAPLTLEPNPNTPTTWSPSLPPPPPPPMRSGSTGSNGSGTGATATTTTTTATSRAPPAIALRPPPSTAASRPSDPALPASAFPPSLPSPFPAASTAFRGGAQGSSAFLLPPPSASGTAPGPLSALLQRSTAAALPSPSAFVPDHRGSHLLGGASLLASPVFPSPLGVVPMPAISASAASVAAAACADRRGSRDDAGAGEAESGEVGLKVEKGDEGGAGEGESDARPPADAAE